MEIEKGVFSPESSSDSIVWAHRAFKGIDSNDPSAANYQDVVQNEEGKVVDSEVSVKVTLIFSNKILWIIHTSIWLPGCSCSLEWGRKVMDIEVSVKVTLNLANKNLMRYSHIDLTIWMYM